MGLKAYNENDIQNIANSIRNKGVSGNFTVAEMASNIDNIPSGGGQDLSNCLVWNQEVGMPYIGNNYKIEAGDFAHKIFNSNNVSLSFHTKGLSNIFARSSSSYPNSILDINLVREGSVASMVDIFNASNFSYLKLNAENVIGCTRAVSGSTFCGEEFNLYNALGASVSFSGLFGPTSYLKSAKANIFLGSGCSFYLQFSLSSTVSPIETLWVNICNNYVNSINLNLRGLPGGSNFYFGYSHNIDNSDVISGFSTYPTILNMVVNNLYTYNSFYKKLGNSSWVNEDNLTTNINFEFYNESSVVNEVKEVQCVRRFYYGNLNVYCTE